MLLVLRLRCLHIGVVLFFYLKCLVVVLVVGITTYCCISSSFPRGIILQDIFIEEAVEVIIRREEVAAK